MAKFGKDIVFEIGEDGEIVLSQPTNKQWNKYQTDKIEAQSEGRDIPALNQVISDFFDSLVKSIVNIEARDDSKITLDTLDKIDIKEKSSMIMQGVEMNNQGIILKN